MAKIQPRVFKGARDFLPSEMIHRERITNIMRNVFKKYGYAPMETPAIEYLNVLAGKYGEDADRLIYKLNYKTGGKDEAALHYDLTVPFSRVIAMNQDLVMPFKRYQIQPVWRADRPQPNQGRFREFYQCDFDAVGTYSLLIEAEMIAIISEVLTALGFKNFRIRINNRKILNALVQFAGLTADKTQDVCRSIDKLDKMPWDKVAEEMSANQIDQAAIDKFQKIFSAGPLTINDIETLTAQDANFNGEGVTELKELFDLLEMMKIPRDNYCFDISLARGLDYYTGPIFETVLPDHPHMGSLSGGGRYDKMIGMFSGRDIPAVGSTLGLDRIFTAMQQLEMMEDEKSFVQVMIANMDDEARSYNLNIAQELRSLGINVMVYPDSSKMKKQLNYADKHKIQYVVIVGSNELKNEEISVKNLVSGEQQTIKKSELANFFSA